MPEELEYKDVPQPGHWSTKIEANKGIGSDYAADRRKDERMPSEDTINKTNEAFKKLYTKGYVK